MESVFERALALVATYEEAVRRLIPEGTELFDAHVHVGKDIDGLVAPLDEREVTTIEGLRDHPLVDSFVRADALQCGYCTPGQIVSASARRAPSRRATQFATAWRGTSAAAAPTCASAPRSRKLRRRWDSPWIRPATTSASRMFPGVIS